MSTITIASGQTASPQVFFTRAANPHVIFVPSLAPNAIFSIAFAPQSGGPTYHRGIFDGRDWIVASAGQPACAAFLPLSAYGRVETAAAVTTPVSCELFALS